MNQDQQPKEEKKIWVDPELTFMPMKNINVLKVHHPSEVTNHNNDDGTPTKFYGS